MSFTSLDLARTVQADRERQIAEAIRQRHLLGPRQTLRRRPRPEPRLRLRWPWQLPRPAFPVGYGR